MSLVWFLYAALIQTILCFHQTILLKGKNGRVVRSSSTNPVIQTLHFLDKMTHVVIWGESSPKSYTEQLKYHCSWCYLHKSSKEESWKTCHSNVYFINLEEILPTTKSEYLFKCSQSTFWPSPDLKPLFFSFFFFLKGNSWKNGPITYCHYSHGYGYNHVLGFKLTDWITRPFFQQQLVLFGLAAPLSLPMCSWGHPWMCGGHRLWRRFNPRLFVQQLAAG